MKKSIVTMVNRLEFVVRSATKFNLIAPIFLERGHAPRPPRLECSASCTMYVPTFHLPWILSTGGHPYVKNLPTPLHYISWIHLVCAAVYTTFRGKGREEDRVRMSPLFIKIT